MNAPRDMLRMVRHEIHRLEKKLDEAQSGINSLELILTEIKWVQEQEEIDVSKRPFHT